MNSIAFIFPGQGSQSIGMLQELAENYDIVKQLFAEVSERLGYDLWQLVQEGPEAQLNQTQFTQAAMLTADVAVYKVLQQQISLAPGAMAGHSLGEYAALVCADALSLADAAALVSKRGQLMQETVPLGQGAMAAIVGLTDDQVKDICEKASTSNAEVLPANYNSIGQVVIAGHTSAVQQAVHLANDAGARMATLIPVSVPCHCPLLNQAAALFLPILAATPFEVPSVPVISNVDLSQYQSVEQIKTLLAKQLYSPVRWVETIQLMANMGINTVIECGPGKVLTGLTKRIDKSIRAMSINDSNSLSQALQILASA